MNPNSETWQNLFPEFSACPDNAVKELLDSAELVTLAAGQQVFYPGKACEHYLLLVSGSIRAQILSEEGREIILYHVHPGEACVLTTSCLLSDDQYPAEAYTESEISAFVIPAEVFHRCLKNSPFFRDFVFKNFSKRLMEVIKRMESISFSSVERRLAQLLIDRAPTLHATHQELAVELSSAREVVSRQLKRFEQLGLIGLSRGRITVSDTAALSRLVNKRS